MLPDSDCMITAELARFARGLRDLYIRTRKVRGVRREESDPFIRLATNDPPLEGLKPLCGTTRIKFVSPGLAPSSLSTALPGIFRLV